MAVGSALEQVLRLGRNMLLSRLLLPDVFGMIALVLPVISLVESLSQIGIREAVIQSSDADDQGFLSAAFFVALCRGVALTAVVAAGAPLAAAFYNRPDLSPMLRVASLGFLFQGAFSGRGYAALKRMDTGRWVFVEQLGMGELRPRLGAFGVPSQRRAMGVCGYLAEQHTGHRNAAWMLRRAYPETTVLARCRV